MTHIALVLAATTAVQAFLTLCVLALPAVAPAFAKALDISPSLIGYQVSIVYAAASACSLIAGTVIRRWGAGRASQSALAFGAAGCALAAVPFLPMLALGSVLMGVGYGLTNPAASHLLMRFSSGRNRNLLFSIKQTGVPIGGILAGLALPSVALLAGWQASLIVPAALCIGLCLLLITPRQRWDDDRNPNAPLSGGLFASVQMIWRSPPLRALSMAGFCFGAVQLSLMSFTVTMLVQEVGFNLVSAGAALSLVQASGVSGRLFWGWLADRLQNALLVLIVITSISLAACISVVWLSAAWPAPAIYAVLAMFGLSAVGWNGVFMAEVARASMGQDVGSATGGASAITFFGVMFGPGLFAMAYAIIGSYAQTFALAAALLMVGLVLVFIADRTTRAAALSRQPAPG